MTKAFTVTFSEGRPAPGKYYAAIAPDLRGRYGWNMAVLKCTVYADHDAVRVEVHHGYKPKVDLSDPVFDGALWAFRKMPADPFASGQMMEVG